MNNKFKDFTQSNIQGFSEFLCQLSPAQFSIIGSLVGLLIAMPLTQAQQNSIGNFLELVGQLILTYNAQQALCNPLGVSKEEFEQTKRELLKKINDIKSKIK